MRFPRVCGTADPERAAHARAARSGDLAGPARERGSRRGGPDAEVPTRRTRHGGPGTADPTRRSRHGGPDTADPTRRTRHAQPSAARPVSGTDGLDGRAPGGPGIARWRPRPRRADLTPSAPPRTAPDRGGGSAGDHLRRRHHAPGRPRERPGGRPEPHAIARRQHDSPGRPAANPSPVAANPCRPAANPCRPAAEPVAAPVPAGNLRTCGPGREPPDVRTRQGTSGRADPAGNLRTCGPGREPPDVRTRLRCAGRGGGYSLLVARSRIAGPTDRREIAA
jgi:hypothetical protein